VEQTLRTFTDSSKSEQGVRSGDAIFTGKVRTEQLQFKVDERCCTNQAEQLAFITALEVIQTLHANNNEHRTAAIYTDSKVTLDSIRSAKSHNHLIEEISNPVKKKKNWTI
jgi:ribonuclease HI